MGMLAVIFVLPIQKFIQANVDSHELQFILWASAEEIIKYLAVIIVLYKTTYGDEPIDWPILSDYRGFGLLPRLKTPYS